MRKILLILLFAVSGSFIFYDNGHAEELSEARLVEEKEVETIYFNEDQEILITDEVIIRRISDTPLINLDNLYSEDENLNLITPLGAGEWDLIGDEFVKKKSNIYPSHGGDYRVVLNQSKFGPYLYSLREQDDIFYQTVKNFSFSGEGVYEMIFRDISGYCDGDDGLAEFFLYKSTMTSTADYVSFWD